MQNRRKINTCKAVIIVHGKSELIMCNYIINNLRLNVKTYSDKNGKKSIQINSLKNIMNNLYFKDFDNFKKMLKKSIEKDNFKIFIIMDTDDCTEKEKDNFKNKNMFKGHWAYDIITPIYNSDNLEDVLTKAGVIFNKKKKKIDQFIEIFPTNNSGADLKDIENLRNKLKPLKNTNLDVLLDFCIRLVSKKN